MPALLYFHYMLLRKKIKKQLAVDWRINIAGKHICQQGPTMNILYMLHEYNPLYYQMRWKQRTNKHNAKEILLLQKQGKLLFPCFVIIWRTITLARNIMKRYKIFFLFCYQNASYLLLTMFVFFVFYYAPRK